MAIRGENPNTVERRSTDVVVHCAGRIGAQPVPVLRVLASAEFPENLSLEASRDLHVREADELAEALFQHLPGGTVDQLLAALLLRRASQLRVRF